MEHLFRETKRSNTVKVTISPPKLGARSGNATAKVPKKGSLPKVTGPCGFIAGGQRWVVGFLVQAALVGEDIINNHAASGVNRYFKQSAIAYVHSASALPSSLNDHVSAKIQALCYRRDQLYNRIRSSEFRFLYRAEGEPIHDEYQEAKRAVERLIKARERALKKQVQAEYDAIAPVNDIQAQLEGNAESVNRTVLTSGPIRYAFVERSRIAQAFFDPLSALGAEGDVGWRVSIVDDLVSLCTLQEGRFRKASRRRKTRVVESPPDDADVECTLNAVTSESKLKSQVRQLFPLRCKPYQCLHCLGNRTLPLDERLHNLGSKFSLQRHFDRCHTFRPGEPCPCPHPECAAVTLNSMMHFKNHAAKVHGIYMSKKM